MGLVCRVCADLVMSRINAANAQAPLVLILQQLSYDDGPGSLTESKTRDALQCKLCAFVQLLAGLPICQFIFSVKKQACMRILVVQVTTALMLYCGDQSSCFAMPTFWVLQLSRATYTYAAKHSAAQAG